MIKLEKLKRAVVALPIILALFFLLNRGISTSSLYMLCIIGVLITLFTKNSSFKYKSNNNSWFRILLLTLFLLILSLVFYSFSKIEVSYYESPYIISLSIIPFLLFFRMLDREESFIYLLIIIFILSGIISHWLGSQDDYGLRVISSRYFKLLYFAPLLIAFKWMDINWKLFFFVSLAGVLGAILVTILSYCCFDLAMGGLVDKFTYQQPISGNTNPIFFGLVSLCLLMSMSQLLLFNFPDNKKLLATLALLPLGLFGVLSTGSRGVWLALICILLIYAIFILSYVQISKSKKYGVIVVALLVGIVLSNTHFVKQRVHDGYVDVQQYIESGEYINKNNIGSSLGTRFELWKSAIKVFENNIVFGVGPGNFKSEMIKLSEQGELDPIFAVYNQAHNQYFHTLATKGLLGMLVLIVFCAYLLWLFSFKFITSGSSSVKYISSCGITIMLCYFILGGSESPFERRSTIVFFTFYISLAVAAIKYYEETVES